MQPTISPRPEKKPMSTGCLVALVIGILFGLVILFHLALAFYFLQARFEIKKVTEEQPVASSAKSDVGPPPPTPVDVESPDKAFVRKGAEQLFGYYFPGRTVKVGKYQLSDIALGAQDDFRQYHNENGWAPVMIAFHDLEVPSASSMAEEDRSRFTVLPSSYTVVGDKISFKAHDDRIGDIAFTGTLNLKMISHYIARGEGSAESVATGDLTINGKVYPDIAFTYSPGD